MKKMVLLFISGLLGISVIAQKEFSIPGKGTNNYNRVGNTGSFNDNLTKLPGGIMAVKNQEKTEIIGFCKDTTGQLVITHKTRKGFETTHQRSSQYPLLPTYHVIFHFDQYSYDVECIGTNNYYNSLSGLLWQNNNTLEGYLEAGNYTLLCLFYLPSGDQTIPGWIIQENFNVYRDMDTTISSAVIHHSVALNIHDENDSLLKNKGLPADCLGSIFEFPGNLMYPARQMIYLIWPADSMKFSDVPADVKISLGKTTAIKDIYTRDHLYHKYVASFPSLLGISKDTILNNDPLTMQYNTLECMPSPAIHEPFWGFSFGYMANSSLLGLDYFLGCFSNNEYRAGESDTISQFISGISNDTSKYFFVSGVLHWETNPLDPSSYNWYINPYLFYVSPNNNLVCSNTGNYPPVAADYLVPSAGMVDFGGSAPFCINWGYNSQANQSISLLAQFTGQTNEARAIDNALGTYDLFEQTQKIAHDSLHQQFFTYYVPNQDIYTLQLNDSNYSLLGKPGYLKTSLKIDFTKYDCNAPSITSLKVLKGDQISRELIHSAPASISLTAGDFEFPNTYPYVICHQVAVMQLFLKNFNDTLWTEVTVSPQNFSFDTLTGLQYIADLEQLLNQFPDSAWIDLKISTSDSSGNNTEEILHPAFLVRDAIAGTGHKTISCNFTIYPNPASNRIFLETSEEHFRMTLYSPEGKVLLEQRDKKEIDVSGMTPGIYLIKLTDVNGLNGRFGKFIKMENQK